MATPTSPLYKPQDEEFYVFSNIGSQDNSSATKTIQMKANDPSFQNFMAAFPEQTHQFYEAKGMSVLAFENTTKQAPGTVNIDAALVANAGYFASEDSRGFFFANAHTSFFNPGNDQNSTPTKLGLLGDGWIKTSLATSEFKPLVEHFQNTNKSKVIQEMKFDVYENKVKDPFSGMDVKVSVIVEKSENLAVATGGTGVSNYNLLDTIGAFVGQTNLKDMFQEAEGGASTIQNKTEEVNGQVVYKETVFTGSNDASKPDNVTASKGGDKIDLGFGDDIVDGGEGADKVMGGAGDDVIDGGANDAKKQTDGLRIQEWGDRAQYKGKAEDFEIKQILNTDGSIKHYEIKDTNTSDGDEGTDIVKNIEILEFSSGGGNNTNEVLLSVNTFKESYIDPQSFQKIEKEIVDGTSFNDEIISEGNARTNIKAGKGDDVIIADKDTDGTSNKGSGDIIDGGEGIDFIDGGATGNSHKLHENNNVVEYRKPSHQFDVKKYIYDVGSFSYADENGNYNTSDKAALDKIFTDLNLTAKLGKYLESGKSYFVVIDKKSLKDNTKPLTLDNLDKDNGYGVDILKNIQELKFSDAPVTIEVFKDPFGGFVRGTDFGDTIQGTGKNEYIEAGAGDDRVYGKDGADTANLGMGNDFFDGGKNKENFDNSQFFEDMGIDTGALNIDAFANTFENNMPGQNPGNFPGTTGDDFNNNSFNNDGSFNNSGAQNSFNSNTNTGNNTYTYGSLQGSYNGDSHNTNNGGQDFVNNNGQNNGDQNNEGQSTDFMNDMNMDMNHMNMMMPVAGDRVEYNKEASKYEIKTYDGDSSELATIVKANFADLVSKTDMWKEDVKYTVVTDTTKGTKNTGIDLLVNVEEIGFNDNSYNLSVQQFSMGDMVDWQGTFGDDVISYNDFVASYDGQTQPDKDFMMGDAGNDVLLAGKGGDTLLGGAGNDIMDGGANGSGIDPWMVNDVVEYQASIDRFSVQKHTFEGKTLKIMDESTKKVAFIITPELK